MSNGSLNKGSLVKGTGGSGGGGGSSIPSQEGQEGKILSTDGENLEWVEKYMPNLFDIKTNSEPTKQKGWSCISYPTQNKLSKDDIESAYDYIKEKLDGCDKSMDTLVTIKENNSNYYKALQCFKAGDNYVIFNDDNKLYKAEDITDSSTWTKINDYVINVNYFGFVSGNNASCYLSYNNGIVIINNEDLSVVKVVSGNITPQFWFGGDGYFYGTDNSNTTYRWKDSTDSDEIELETVTAQFGFLAQSSCKIGKIFTEIDGYVYFNVVSTSGQGIVACRATDITDVSTYEAIGYWTQCFLDYNHWEERFLLANTSYNVVVTATTEETSPNGSYDGVPLFKFDETRPFDELNNLNLSEYTSYTLRKRQDMFYSTHWGTNILKFESEDRSQVLFLATEDFENYTKLVDGSYYSGSGITSILYDETELVISDCNVYNGSGIYSRLRTASTEFIEYTDTINGIDINYYKNGDWKICVKDDDNDDNLQAVYEFLGYLNYWWIDEENEEISLQRDSRLWTMMYVGDDYEDDELPSGNYIKNKLINELIEIDDASITIDIKGNQFYKFTNNAITDITIDSCDDSIEETTIKFTTGNSAPTLTDNANLEWCGGIPTLLANASYTIVIVDKTAYYQEN